MLNRRGGPSRANGRGGRAMLNGAGACSLGKSAGYRRRSNGDRYYGCFGTCFPRRRCQWQQRNEKKQDRAESEGIHDVNITTDNGTKRPRL
jgi:hypothetical protein